MVEATLGPLAEQRDDIKLEVTVEPGIEPPSYRSSSAAGLDLACSEDIELAPMERKLVPTGLRIAIPPGFEGQVRPRSGLAIRHGITMVNTPGTIDSDYRGEVLLALINLGTETVRLQRGDRVAQLVICPVARVKVTVVETLGETERGEGGFGSTGTR